MALSACNGPPPAPRYYERVIQPILTGSCVRNQGACHKDDGNGNALGNLDLTSYEALQRRPDVLRRYGSYPLPLLLLKATNGDVPPIPYSAKGDGQEYLLPVEIRHVGGSNIQANTNAFLELQKWLDIGATRDGRLDERPQQSGTGACSKDFALARPDLAARLGEVDTSSQAFSDFASKVEPKLTESCAFATCHSSEQSDFFITCKGSGSDDATKFNFLAAQAFLSEDPELSQLLLRPLSPQAGGISHTGGVFFDSKLDSTWSAWHDWALLAGQGLGGEAPSPAQQFFNAHVMPVFLQRGCALEGCHSPGAANDFKLRAGSGGFFAKFALHKSYESTREFLAPEIADPRQSRIIKKPVVSAAEGGIGLLHRGGPPLQSPSDDLDPANCPSPWTEGVSTPFCTLVEWHRLEREALLAKGEADSLAASSSFPFAVVVRPPNADRLIDFDTFRGGADLQLGSIPMGANFATNPAGATIAGSLLDSCPGVGASRDNIDVRGPEFSYGGDRVVFAMRIGESDTLDLYEVTLSPRACVRLTTGGPPVNGLPVHSLDPVYGPDDSIVFVSTRGVGTEGPTRSLKYLLPQTDVWRLPRVGDAYGPAEPMTHLRGSELSPAMMANGQLTFTAEKATADFYQLSGRRINWDKTDYHPLLAQRAQSRDTQGTMKPSVNYSQATEIREGLDRNFVFILSDDGTKGGGGALGLFNRSIGPFEADRTGEITFLRSLTIVDPMATGRAGPTVGAYRSPALMPDGRILVSYAPDVTDLAAATSVRYDLVVIDPVTGTRTPVAGLTGGASSRVEAITGYKRERRKTFRNFTQLVFGGRVDPDPTRATVHYPDLPMVATLLGANLRSGRFVDSYRPATQVVIYAAQAPPSDLSAAMAGRIGSQMVYDQRQEVGRAPLKSDGSVHLALPPLTPVYAELQDATGNKLFTMTEQDQLGPGEHISRGVPQKFFNSVCGGCHGSVSGRELDVAIVTDALTGASVSLSRDPSTIISIP